LVAGESAWAVAESVAGSGLDAVTGGLVAVATFLAHAVVGAGLRYAGVALVALKAHAAVKVGVGVVVVAAPRTYAVAALLVAEAAAWAGCVGITNVVASLGDTSRAVVTSETVATVGVEGTESCLFAESVIGAETPAGAVVVASAAPTRLSISGVAAPIVTLVATGIVAVGVAVPGACIVFEIEMTASKGG